MKVIAAGILLLLAAFALSLLMALPTMWLWNWLVPSIFGSAKSGSLKRSAQSAEQHVLQPHCILVEVT